MTRALLAAAAIATAIAIAALTACEPEYVETTDQATGSEAQAGRPPERRLEVTGGAEPAALSGGVPPDTAHTIHHPEADGNAGRPSDDRAESRER